MNLFHFFVLFLLIIFMIVCCCIGEKKECKCCPVSEIEVIEDDSTTEEEDMTKALALSKTYFWQKMVEGWQCSEETLNQLLYVQDKSKGFEDLKTICKYWKMMALTADTFVKSWEKCKKKENGSSTMSSISKDANLKVKVNPPECMAIKPLFLLKKWKKNEEANRHIELQLSSAMAAIVLMCREMLLKGSEGDEYFTTIKIEIENQKDCSVPVQKPNDFDGYDLNNLTYVVTNENGEKRNLLHEVKTSTTKLLTQIGKNFIVKKEGRENNTVEMVNNAHAEYEKLWSLVPEIEIDLIKLCWIKRKLHRERTAFLTEFKQLNFDQKYGLFVAEMLEDLDNFSKSSYDGQMQIEYAAILGLAFMAYEMFVYAPIKEKHEQEMDEFMTKQNMRDPCEEAKFRVKKTKKNMEEQHDDDEEQPNKDDNLQGEGIQMGGKLSEGGP